MNKALKDAGVAPGQVDLVIPSGYGQSDWDRADVAALKAVFGSPPTIFPARAGIGDCGAGAQALDLAAAALVLRDQTIPPAVNCEHPIDGLSISRQKTARPLANVLVLACALGGQNSAIVLKKIT